MAQKIISLLFLLLTGCGKTPAGQYAIYEVFRTESTNKLVKLVPTNNAYHCQKGDQISIHLQHIGPDRDSLCWEAHATKLESPDIKEEEAYSTLRPIALSESHNFTANQSGAFAITCATWLTRGNVPMKTVNQVQSIQSEGQLMLVVQDKELHN